MTASPAPRLHSLLLGCTVWAWLPVQLCGMLSPMAAASRDLEALAAVRVPTGTLSTGLCQLSEFFQPLVDAVKRQQCEPQVVYVDETTWPVQAAPAAGDSGDPAPKRKKK